MELSHTLRCAGLALLLCIEALPRQIRTSWHRWPWSQWSGSVKKQRTECTTSDRYSEIKLQVAGRIPFHSRGLCYIYCSEPPQKIKPVAGIDQPTSILRGCGRVFDKFVIWDKFQWIVAQRPLSTLTIPGLNLIVFQKSHALPTEHLKSLSLSCGQFTVVQNQLWMCAAVGNTEQHRIISTDSDLEAFSRNPPDGSFATISFLITALPAVWTNCSSRTRFDYCHNTQVISRVKLTCLTTV